LLESCLDPLDNAIRELEAASPAAEKVASDLHDAAHALSGLLGRVTPDDVLDRIFSSFCIGK
jgi:tRNA modification GTPase